MSLIKTFFFFTKTMTFSTPTVQTNMVTAFHLLASRLAEVVWWRLWLSNPLWQSWSLSLHCIHHHYRSVCFDTKQKTQQSHAVNLHHWHWHLRPAKHKQLISYKSNSRYKKTKVKTEFKRWHRPQGVISGVRKDLERQSEVRLAHTWVSPT